MVRWQVPVVLGAVVAGTVLGLSADVGDWSERLVVPALVTLLALTFAGIGPAAFTSDVGPHRRVVASSLVLNFVWAPLAAGVLGWLLLTGSPELRIGLVMLLVTPCTDWYLIFTATARGNVPLSVALLPVNLVLQLALLPVFIVVLTWYRGRRTRRRARRERRCRPRDPSRRGAGRSPGGTPHRHHRSVGWAPGPARTARAGLARPRHHRHLRHPRTRRDR